MWNDSVLKVSALGRTQSDDGNELIINIGEGLTPSPLLANCIP